MSITPDDKKKIQAALRKISDVWSEMEAGRDAVKAINNDICDELDLDKKAFGRLAKVFHKQNFEEEEQNHEIFRTLYKATIAK